MDCKQICLSGTLSVLIGDTGESLYWHCWENDMGKRGMPAKACSWEEYREIRNLDDLCELIEADMEKEKGDA